MDCGLSFTVVVLSILTKTDAVSNLDVDKLSFYRKEFIHEELNHNNALFGSINYNFLCKTKVGKLPAPL